MTTSEQVRELIDAGQWYAGAGEFTIDRHAADQIIALVDALEAEITARRLVMAEQERIAAMPRSVSWGGVGPLPRLRG